MISARRTEDNATHSPTCPPFRWSFNHCTRNANVHFHCQAPNWTRGGVDRAFRLSSQPSHRLGLHPYLVVISSRNLSSSSCLITRVLPNHLRSGATRPAPSTRCDSAGAYRNQAASPHERSGNTEPLTARFVLHQWGVADWEEARVTAPRLADARHDNLWPATRTRSPREGDPSPTPS